MKDEFDMGFLDDLILQVDEKVDTLKREIANKQAPPMKSFVLRSTSSGKIFPIKNIDAVFYRPLFRMILNDPRNL